MKVGEGKGTDAYQNVNQSSISPEVKRETLEILRGAIAEMKKAAVVADRMNAVNKDIGRNMFT